MVLGRLLRTASGGSSGDRASPSGCSAGALGIPTPTSPASARLSEASACERCLLDVRAVGSARSLVPSGKPVLFVDLEGTLLRTFSRDDLRALPEDTHFARSQQGDELLLRIRPYALDFLARMKRDCGFAVAVYAASSRCAVVAKVEALERARPGFRFDFIVDQDTVGAWENGKKQLSLVLGSAKAARNFGFLIDTKDNHVQRQAQASESDSRVVNAVEVPEFGPFMADKDGNLADMRIIYGMMTAGEVEPSYTNFRNFEVENATFRNWMRNKVTSGAAAASRAAAEGAASRKPGGAADEDWEMVEAAPATLIDPVVVDDYLLVESASGPESCSESGMATPRQETSDAGEEDDERVDFVCAGTGAAAPRAGAPPAAEPALAAGYPAATSPSVGARSPAAAARAAAVGTPSSPSAPTATTETYAEAGEKASAEAGEKARAADEASEGSSTTTDDEPSFRCLACRSPLFKACDIISSNYHAQTSPGYLLSTTRNVNVSKEVQTATYTTGKYSIQEVTCSSCDAALGVTYCGASDAQNQYKVGKFLVGRDRLALPPGVTHPMDKNKS